MKRTTGQFGESILNSYSQIFFSDNRVFALMLLGVSFTDLYAGIYGLLAVLVTSLTGFAMGFDRNTVAKGLYGFNSLLVGLGLGIYFQPGIVLTLIIILSAIFTFFISVAMQGIIGKYNLPYLSVPFILAAWMVTLATREFTTLGISERGIFTINEMYILGGGRMVAVYEWWNSIGIARPLRIYFISLGAILFQYNTLAGMIIAAGLLFHSRISFSLSLLGFFTAYLFYGITGTGISDFSYSYIGFNYILTSIAIGGFFVIPSYRSYFWVVLMVPLVALLTISLSSVFAIFSLPLFALPFNLVVLLFIYVLKFRTRPSPSLAEVVIQQNSPERNLYSYVNELYRFRYGVTPVKLPFFGVWEVSQGYEGEYTHKGDWKYAWDFVITDSKGLQFKGEGLELSDYYCFDKPVIAVADGVVEYVENGIKDNITGEVNLVKNWGNTVIIKHADYLYSKISHLRAGSVTVNEGDKVVQGEVIGHCGNSGRSPYPHLHFQMQATPWIGSRTIKYPLSYYIHHEGESTFSLKNYYAPAEGDRVSNAVVNDLVKSAFKFIPGRDIRFRVSVNGKEMDETWEAAVDEYNNRYLRCSETGSVSWFVNDGNMLIFRHYDGGRRDFLYWVHLSLYRVQQGFYPGLKLHDRYPLNLYVRRWLQFFQDFVAPFFLFVRSEYQLFYKSTDSEISPTRIVLESVHTNRVAGFVTRETRSEIVITESGISRISIKGKGINIMAECREQV
ncbi:MAG: urea transporter [Bacteroidales bacterium]|nr:urea transporter [Bacteroidales bacterium]